MRRRSSSAGRPQTGSRHEFVRDLRQFPVRRRKAYLLVIYAVLSIFGGLIALTQGTAVAPFIYTLF
jgi:hypothetical protein